MTKEDQQKPKQKPKPYKTREPIIRKVSEIDASGTYTYSDYLKWKIEERVELIKGKIFEMSAPNRVHQGISREIFGKLYNYLKGKPCKVYSAPFDIRLPGKSKANNSVYTVLQPDLCVICDREKLDAKGCIGAPDIVVEILSPSNSKKELRNKYEVYEEYGVKEYWVVFPEQATINQYILNDAGKYTAGPPLVVDDILTTAILPDFTLPLLEVFEEML